MRTFYDRRAENEKVRARLHLDRRFYDRLPKLEPLGYDQKEVEELIAWALVFGYIAQQDGKLYWSVREVGSNMLPKYDTEWEPLLQDLLPTTWTRRLLKKASSDVLLGDSRQALFAELTRDNSRLNTLRNVQAQVEQEVDLQTLIERVDECIDQLHQRIESARTPAEAKPLEEDMHALERYQERLSQRLKW